MHLFREGDKDAFEHIYKHFNKRVFFYVRQYLSSITEAQDITSECFFRLWEKKAEFPSLDAVGAFLHVAARNLCFNYLKHAKMAREKEGELLSLLNMPDDNGFKLEELRMQLLNLIAAEVDKLPSKMKKIFLLSYEEGLKPAQIAERLGLQVQTVKNQRLNAVKLIKAALADHPSLLALLLLLESKSPVFG
ncbi:RNA polymerase sigma-70 factor (ECF subfamily) [Pseudobacter ginsenosidimutans]|uniref:RNA polymerase sigma-70 factor (ECF subfamily) n=2 Tax=Pseudobacter ginsenosidimutans TaxID=661488 RepID=A0A4Q7N0W2_9BACT|nr:RNA polymerase sigma-70 factor (ECF subfamily) [Pseudobacter ginsenosidimutans]